ncbi:MAG: UDP-2,3-diacylglucosamine diphosphatase LpxI [Spirochaetia bacterium]|nr:UDP-2,3-diacylglucosamine diphosphatase LpxI [Spirochaetia bacterium]
MKIKKLGIIAGSGILPALTADSAIKQNVETVIYAVEEEDFSNKKHNLHLRTISKPVTITQVGKAIKQFKKDGITHLVMIGKITKEHLFKDLKFDLKTLWMLRKLINRNDDTIFFALADELKKNGVDILPQDYFLKDLFLPEGVYSKKKPSAQDLKDIKYGMYYAKKMGQLDIGQTVVVRFESVLAVEAIEGTDECIKRGGRLSRNKGAVVCKAEKAKQDARFDVPAIGVQTLETIKKNGAHALAFEAGKTLIVTPESVIKKANELQLILAGTSAPSKL